MSIRTVVLTILGIIASNFIGVDPATAQGSDAWLSAHFCRVVGPKHQAVAYHSAGSLIALENDVKVTCPIATNRNVGSNFHALVYFRTPSATGRNLIKCWINRINKSDLADQGVSKAAGIETTDVLELDSGTKLGGGNIIGANVVCELSKNAKILGYLGYFKDP